jgi:hypothetical protein
MFATHSRNTRQVKVGGKRGNVYLFWGVFSRKAKMHAKKFDSKPS